MHIAVAATFVAEPFVSWLRWWLDYLGLASCRLELAAYASLLRELSAPAVFAAEGTAACVALVHFDDWQRGSTLPFDATRFDRDFELFKDAVDACIRRVRRLLLVVCPSAPLAEDSESGSGGGRLRSQCFEDATRRLCSLMNEHPRLIVLTPDDVQRWYPVITPHDPVSDAVGHVPFSDEGLVGLSGAAARALLPSLAPPLKLVVCDCDYTLWSHAVAEVGASEVAFELRHLLLQRRLLALARGAGVYVCLCSRNDEGDVWAAMARDECELRREHIAAYRIAPALSKSQAVASLAASLEVGLDATLFIDDNASEIGEVRAARPEVACWLFPAASDNADADADASAQLEHVWRLDAIGGATAGSGSGTQEGVQRSAPATLRARDAWREAQAAAVAASVTTAAATPAVAPAAAAVVLTDGDAASPPPAAVGALRALHAEMDVRISFRDVHATAADSATLERVLQLSERTNQYNAWKRHLAPSHLEACRAAQQCGAAQACGAESVSVSDRYGDYGLVGVILWMCRPPSRPPPLPLPPILDGSPTVPSLLTDGACAAAAPAAAAPAAAAPAAAAPAAAAPAGSASVPSARGWEGADAEGEVRCVGFMMSCRVLGRGVEYRMLARLGEIACEIGFPTVCVGACSAARNQPILRFFERIEAQLRTACATAGASAGAARMAGDSDDRPGSSGGDGGTGNSSDGAVGSIGVQLAVVASSADNSEQPLAPSTPWLEAAPERWFRYPAAALSTLSFDPDAVAALEAMERNVDQGNLPGTSVAPPQSQQTEASRLAAALTRMPTDMCTVAQALRERAATAADGEMEAETFALGAPPDEVRACRALRLLVRRVLRIAAAHTDDAGSADHDGVPLGALGLDSTLAVTLIALAARHGLALPHEAWRYEQLCVADLAHLATQGGAHPGAGAIGSAPAAVASEAAAAVAPIRVGRSHYGAKGEARTALQILERDSRKLAAHDPLRDVGGLAACAAGDLITAQALAASGAWPVLYAIDKHGSNALMWSASYGRLAVARWLIDEMGVDVNARNKQGRTALMFAAKYGQLQVLNFLLGAGADVGVRMRDESSAFDWAVLGGHQPTMEALAERVDLEAVNRFGCAAVQWAAAAGNVETLRWLQRRGVRLDHINAAHHGAVVKAAWKGHDDALRWLLLDGDGPQLKAQLGMRDPQGRSVAQLAAMNGMAHTAQWLAPLVEQYGRELQPKSEG